MQQPLSGLLRPIGWPLSVGRGLFARIDALWGYDVFIAHRRSDGAAYAKALYDGLAKQRINAFLDRNIYGPGDSLAVSTKRHVGKSTMMVLVSSPDVYARHTSPDSIEPDWVEQEIDTYLANNPDNPKILVIDFGVAMEAAQDRPIAKKLWTYLRIGQSRGALGESPSTAVIESIQHQLGSLSRDRSRLRVFQAIAAVLFVFLSAAIVAAIWAVRERDAALRSEANAQSRLEAQLRLAEIDTDAQRDALYLAVRDVAFAQSRLGAVPAHTWSALRAAYEASREIGRFDLPDSFAGTDVFVRPHPVDPDRIVIGNDRELVQGVLRDGQLEILEVLPKGHPSTPLSQTLVIDPLARYVIALPGRSDQSDDFRASLAACRT